MFFENPDVFTEDFMVDELVDFFIAGSQTIQFVSQTIISHFATQPESLAKVREEFESQCLIENSTQKSKAKLLKKHLTYESLTGLNYLN